MPRPSEDDIAEEQLHFAKVVSTFKQYGPYAVGSSFLDELCRIWNTLFQLAANNRRRKDLYSLSPEDRKILDELGWKNKLADIDNAILENAKFVRQMIAQPEIFSDADLGEDAETRQEQESSQSK